MIRWIVRIFLGLIVAAAAAYAGDWAVYHLRKSPTENITVSHFVSAPLKNNKEEIDYLGSEVVACSLSWFPQNGHTPCWYLRNHKNQTTTY